MNDVVIKVDPYYWFNEKNLVLLKELVEVIPNSEYALELIKLRIEVINIILEKSSLLEENFNKKFSYFNPEELDSKDLIDIVISNLKIETKKVSAVIIVFNEERCINRCINSIINKVDEIVIVDTGSTDNTMNLIKEYNNENIKLYNFQWNNNFSEARNFAKSKANNDWIFFIDADEYIEDSSNISLILNSFNNIPVSNSLVISPLITNSNGHNILTVKRIFLKSSNINFFGKIHEEPRKDIDKSGKDLVYISLKININHDGYLNDVMKSKDKIKRNITLLKDMLSIEPHNPRWAYFLVRDGFEIMNLQDIENIIYNSVLIDINYKIDKINLKYHEFTFAFLDILAKIKLITKEFSQLDNILIILNEMIPNNSNSFYYSIMSNFIQIKDKTQDLLNKTIKYREDNYYIQPGMIHSNGYHIDFLIGMLLFETAKYKSSFKYFDFLEDKYTDLGIIKNYKPIINLKEYI